VATGRAPTYRGPFHRRISAPPTAAGSRPCAGRLCAPRAGHLAAPRTIVELHLQNRNR
jgi:hypothetical protein